MGCWGIAWGIAVVIILFREYWSGFEICGDARLMPYMVVGMADVG